MLSRSKFIGLIFGLSLISCSLEGPTGAGNGEFLGYRIGAQYTVTNATKLFHWSQDWGYVLATERPVKPDEFGTVYLVVTKMTYTILAITSSRDFASQRDQMEFANKYTGILAAQYPKTPRSTGENGTTFSFGPADEHQKGYLLYLNTHKQNIYSNFTGNQPVHIGLTYRSNHDLYQQALKESADQKRGEAAEKGLNRGL